MYRSNYEILEDDKIRQTDLSERRSIQPAEAAVMARAMLRCGGG